MPVVQETIEYEKINEHRYRGGSRSPINAGKGYEIYIEQNIDKGDGHGDFFQIGNLTIRPFSLCHDAADPVGFIIHSKGVKIGIATDLGVATRLVSHHLTGCSLLVLEANHDVKMLEDGPYPWELKQRIRSRLGHLSNEASRDLLKEVCGPELQHVILAHVSETNNRADRVLSVIGEAAGLRAVFQYRFRPRWR